MIIKPAPGLKVRDPVSKRLLPAEGLEVPETNTYWARRLRSGDVVRVEAPASDGLEAFEGKPVTQGPTLTAQPSLTPADALQAVSDAEDKLIHATEVLKTSVKKG